MNARRNVKFLIVTLLYGGLVSCGDDEVLGGTLLDCTNPTLFEACGGDLTGLWQATSSCVTAGGALEGDSGTCGVPTIFFEVGLAGSLRFSANNLIDSFISFRERTRATLPKTCLPEFEFPNGGTPPETCEDIVPSEPLDTCVDRGEECLCSGTFVDANFDSGTFENPETGVLLVTRSDGAEDRIEYCIRDRILDTRIIRLTPIGTHFTVVTRWLK